MHSSIDSSTWCYFFLCDLRNSHVVCHDKAHNKKSDMPVAKGSASTSTSSAACTIQPSCSQWCYSMIHDHQELFTSFNPCVSRVSEWVSSFLSAHQHILGYLVPVYLEWTLRWSTPSQEMIHTVSCGRWRCYWSCLIGQATVEWRFSINKQELKLTT